jgi:PEP-CTERM motif
MKTTVSLLFLVMTLAAPAVSFAGNRLEPVPEPATGLILLVGASGVAAYRKLRAPKE